MHILHINNLYHPYRVGGAERSVQALAEQQHKDGARVSVLTLTQENTPIEEELNGVAIHRIPLKNLHWPFGGTTHSSPRKLAWHLLDIFNPAMARAARPLLQTLKPDLVHTHNLSGFSVALWSVVKELNRPLVHTLRDFHLLCYRSNMFKAAKSCDKPCLDCRLLNSPKRTRTDLPDHVVGISQHILQKHQQAGFFSGTPSNIVFNPVKPQHTARAPRTGDTQLNVAYIGRLSEQKGVSWLIDTFCDPYFKGKARLSLAGEGQDAFTTALKKKSADLPIEWLGFAPPETVLREADVLIVPSQWEEPFGRVVIEAHAAGVPVIASKLGGLAEIVKDGETGLFIDPSRPKSLKEAAQRFIETPDLSNDMAQACRNNAAGFTPSVIAAQYQSIYDEACN